MPVFRGVRYQRGHGLGNVISLFRRVVLPFLKKQKDVHQKCAENWKGSGRRWRISEIVREEALTQGIKRTAGDVDLAFKETEDARRTIVENDGIRTRAFL